MKRRGFTLIELLVVIAIIGMLTSIVLVSMGGARQRARDAKRMADIRQISTAMELCFQDPSAACGGSDTAYPAVAVDANGRITSIGGQNAIGTYLSPIPQDPGGGSLTACSGATIREMTAGGYCAFASPAGPEYCIYAQLSDGRIIAASEKGVQFMTSRPASMSACP
jgi:prepilin-type N-terminal cleavage/methylation domain-containing protein